MRLLRVAFLAGLVSAIAGCVTVKPYERELLTLPGMSLEPQAGDQHVFESREGSSGAYGSVGSGCGCN